MGTASERANRNTDIRLGGMGSHFFDTGADMRAGDLKRLYRPDPIRKIIVVPPVVRVHGGYKPKPLKTAKPTSRTREAVNYYLKGYSDADIAAMMNLSKKQVRDMIRDAERNDKAKAEKAGAL